MTDLHKQIKKLNESLYDSKKLYDKDYLKLTLSVIEDDLDDLHKWSVWNEDICADEIQIIESAFLRLKAKLTE